MPQCPFCKAFYSPRAITYAEDDYDEETDTWKTIEAYECRCGAWNYDGLEDEQ
jgi:hypothetical protein